MQKKLSLQAISFAMAFIFCCQLQAFSRERDHANVLDPRHEQDAEKYMRPLLMSDGVYDLAKIIKFKERLIQEQKEKADNLYENELLENLVVLKKKYSKAHEKALEEQDPHKNDLLIGYAQLLIPQVEHIEELVRLDARAQMIDPLVDEFVRLYMPYFDPSLKRTIFQADVRLKSALGHVFKPYRLKYPQPDTLEANNLQVGLAMQAAVSSCLGFQVDPAHFLEPEETKKLFNCGIDLSLFDPGISTLWKDPKTPWYERNPADFPTQDAKIKYDRITFKGVGSPKFRVTFKSAGKKKKLKVKQGDEVHSDYICSVLGEFVGFNHDAMEYRARMRIHLGKKHSYDEFASIFAGRFGVANFNRLIVAHGQECKNKASKENPAIMVQKCSDWFDLKDVLIESQPKEELRLGPINSYGWDNQNRREFRARLLWFAWLGFQDTKSENHKAVFRKTDDGYLNMHRFQDTGYALGKGSFIQKPHDALVITSKYKINDFETYVSKRDAKGVKVWWNDYGNSSSRFDTATWFDARWMARKIAAISDEQYYAALTTSGIAPEVVDLYRHKLALRRNNIVEAFGLENEYPLFHVPDLEHFSPNDAIKNGKVVQTAFEGKNDLMVTQRGLWVMVAELFNAVIPLGGIEHGFSESGQTKASAQIQGLASFNLAAGVSKQTKEQKNQTFNSTFLGAGISATVGRRVSINPQLLSTGGKGRPFLVTDTLSIALEPNTGAISRWLSYLPVSFTASLKIFRKEIKLYHFAETKKEAFSKSYSLFKALKNTAKFCAEDLDAMEVLKFSDVYGLQAAGEVGVNLYGVLSNTVGVQAGAFKSAPIYISRDQFNVLHIYRENTREVYAGANVALLKPKLAGLSIPLVGLEFTKNNFFHHGVDYTFKLPSYDRDLATVRAQWEIKRDRRALKLFFEDPKSAEFAQSMHKNFEIVSKGSTKKSSAHAFFYFGKRKQSGKATTAVLLNDGKEHHFHYSYTDKRSVHGTEFSLPYVTDDLLVKKGLGAVIRSEVDEFDPENYVISVTIEDFNRRLNRQKLQQFINKINLRFSVEPTQTFYRDYTLPPASVIDEYRKLYSVTRVYIKGYELLSFAVAHKKKEIKELARAHFGTQPIKKHSRLASFDKKRRFLHTYKKLRAAIKQDAPLKRRTHLAEKLVARLHIEEHGVLFLKQILGLDNIFLTGDISGILRSFSPLQEMQDSTNYRFMAKSWGTYGAVPPIQKFLRYGHYVLPSLFIRPGMNEEFLFGSLEQTLARAG